MRNTMHEQNLHDWHFEIAALDKLRALGFTLVPVELPDLPYGAMLPLLEAEAAAAFDDLTISGRDRLLTEQGAGDWPNTFRVARFYPAVEYIQANRARSLAIREFSKVFEQVDVVVAPTFADQLVTTNLTGHPAIIVPNGLRGPDSPRLPAGVSDDNDNVGGPGTPVSITFLGGHSQDAKICALARAYQEATGFHKQHPKLD
jgi:Asp-tRNA(Asn)/Glu-tRNA(Gln) amidotransferase A subunit family amidase